MNAADVMVTNVITVHPDTSVKEIAETLVANRISAVPVVDDSGGSSESSVKGTWFIGWKWAPSDIPHGGSNFWLENKHWPTTTLNLMVAVLET